MTHCRVLAPIIYAVVIGLYFMLGFPQPEAQSASEFSKGANLVVDGVAQDDPLNLRAQPGVGGRIQDRLPLGTAGIVATGKQVRVGSNTWIQVKYRGHTGWLNARYVRAARSIAAPAPYGTPAQGPIKREAGRRVALVVGNARYSQTTPLKNPANDARAIANALKRVGFQDVALHIDTTRKQLSDAIAGFTATARDAKLALVYFAGHGLQVDGASYLLPTDANLKTADDIASQAIELNSLLRKIDSTRALKLVIVDACRDNPFRTRLADAETVRARSVGYIARSIGRGLGRVEGVGHDILVAYAARDGSLAFDGEGKNSPFVAAFLKQLATPGVEVGLLFRRVRDEVLAATSRRQEPYTYGSIGGEEVYLWPIEGGLLLDNDGARLEPNLRKQTDPLVAALKSANLKALSTYVHPSRGVSIYGVTIHRKDLATPGFGERIFTWAASDESGERPTVSVSVYLRRLYKGDYLRAAEVSFNDRHRANMETAPLALVRRPGAVFVDYHIKSATSYGTDWTTLRLIFEKANDRWFLVEIESLTADP